LYSFTSIWTKLALSWTLFGHRIFALHHQFGFDNHGAVLISTVDGKTFVPILKLRTNFFVWFRKTGMDESYADLSQEDIQQPLTISGWVETMDGVLQLRACAAWGAVSRQHPDGNLH
jgi:hypothetical protein